MSVSLEMQVHPSSTLKSGHFYQMNSVAFCYRINEVDHFRKAVPTNIWCYFDQNDCLHHFNRPHSKQAAASTLKDVFQVHGIQTIEFREIDQETLSRLYSRNASSLTQESDILVDKLVKAFFGNRDQAQGVEHDISQLKQQYMPEYLQPPDLN